MSGPIWFHEYVFEGIAMYFSLLVSPLPHATDAYGDYPDVLARAAQTHRIRLAVARCFSRIAARLRRVG
jgi:hypothetical protein